MQDNTFSKFYHVDGDYSFRGLEKNDQPRDEELPQSYIQFGNFNSISKGLWLLERETPTPNEKEITDSVPYQQGEYDFSLLDGQRFFEPRELSYKFVAFDHDYRYRSSLEHEIKRQLMPYGYQWLEDSHINGYRWWAKCTEVSVEDSAEDGTVIATIQFRAMPFAFTEHDEGDDVWDDVNFDHWIFQYTKFDVNGTRAVSIQNIGGCPVECKIETTGDAKVNDVGDLCVLDCGKNDFTLTGNGSVKFSYKRQEMI